MTFTFTLEELACNHNCADRMRRKFKEKIAHALLQERLSRKLTLNEVSQNVKILPERIEALELGKGKINWKFIGILLKYYKKKFQILLVDNPLEEDNVGQ